MGKLPGRRAVSLAVLSSVVIGLGACSEGGDPDGGGDGAGAIPSPSEPAGPPRPGGELRVGLLTDIVTLDPAGQFGTPANLTVANAVYDQLLVAREGENVPSLAESLTASADLLTYTLTLRPGVEFSDGEPLDAEAVVTNFERFMDPETECVCAPLVAGIAEVTAVDPLTVEFRLAEPNVGFSTVLAKEPGYMVSPLALETPAGVADNPVGTGPFILDEWVKGDHVTLRRNPNYWQADQPYLDSITYRIVPDAQSRFQSLRAGSLDVIQTDSADHIVEAAGSGDLAVRLASFNGSSAMTLNLATAPFDDPRVRQAVAYAVDRSALSEVIDKGISEPSDGPFAVDSPLYADPGYPAFDPERARQLVGEVGTPIEFGYQVGQSGIAPQRATVIQQMLDQVGITMNIEPLEFTTIVANVVGGDFQAADLPTPDFTDPDVQLTRRFQTGSAQNWGGYSSQVVDDALARGRTSADPAQRAQAYAELSRALATDLPYIWLTRNYYGVISDPAVGGWQPLDAANLGVFRPERLWIAS
jgi:peptide/nickel transport system substrate-binding protein